MTAPSSPPVTIPAPSWLHLAAKQAPAFDRIRYRIKSQLKKRIAIQITKKNAKWVFNVLFVG